MQIELALADTAYSNGKVDVFALSVEIIWRELQLTQAIEGMHENMSDQALHVKIGT